MKVSNALIIINKDVSSQFHRNESMFTSKLLWSANLIVERLELSSQLLFFSLNRHAGLSLHFLSDDHFEDLVGELEEFSLAFLNL